MRQRINWSRKEQLLALHLYCCLPFGKLHQHNPSVVLVAHNIARTPSAVAMKACNFASLDPVLARKGLGNVSRSDRDLWHEFLLNSESIAAEAEATFEALAQLKPDPAKPLVQPTGPSESIAITKTRRLQAFFRKSVLVSYDHQCALSGIPIPDLIIASHIIPWSENRERRADPTNGIALNPLYDKAFDRGLITVGEQYQIVVSNIVKEMNCSSQVKLNLFNIEGVKLMLPGRFLPDPEALKWHRENRFKA